MSATVNLRIRKGKTFRKTLYWCGSDVNGALTGIDLSGCTAVAQIRESVDSDDVVLEMSTAEDNGMISLSNLEATLQVRNTLGEIVTLPEGTGKIMITIPAETTAALEISRGVWEPEITFSDNSVNSPIDISQVFVINEVTRVVSA